MTQLAQDHTRMSKCCSTSWTIASTTSSPPQRKEQVHMVPKTKYTVSIIDNDPAIRESLGRLLRSESSGKPFFSANGEFLGYRGVSADVTAAIRADQAEEALRKARTELAHVSRLTALAQLTASITPEVTQPLASLVAEAEACLRWLDHGTPNLDDARENVARVIKKAHRAGEVIPRVRGLSEKTDPQ